MRGIGAAALAMVLLATGLVLLTEPPAAALPLPPRGEAIAAWMPDGLPVLVSRAPDGTAHVLDARNPHRIGWWRLTGWCSSAGLFEDSWDGSRFTVSGKWAAGPAPHGLTPYETQTRDGVVLVGRRGQPVPRDPRLHRGLTTPPEYEARGPSCLGSGDVERYTEHLVVHEAAGRVPPVDEVVAAHAGGAAWLPATGAMLSEPGEDVRLCRVAAIEPLRCYGEVAWPGSEHDHHLGEAPRWIHVRGRLLVRVASGRVTDVAVLAGAQVEHGLAEGSSS